MQEDQWRSSFDHLADGEIYAASVDCGSARPWICEVVMSLPPTRYGQAADPIEVGQIPRDEFSAMNQGRRRDNHVGIRSWFAKLLSRRPQVGCPIKDFG